MTHAEYVRNKMIRQHAIERITPTEHYWIVLGEKLTKEQLDAKYPIHGLLINWKEKHYYKGENPDGRNKWLRS